MRDVGEDRAVDLQYLVVRLQPGVLGDTVLAHRLHVRRAVVMRRYAVNVTVSSNSVKAIVTEGNDNN